MPAPVRRSLASSLDQVGEFRVFSRVTRCIDVKAECNARPRKHIPEKVKRLLQIVDIETAQSIVLRS